MKKRQTLRRTPDITPYLKPVDPVSPETRPSKANELHVATTRRQDASGTLPKWHRCVNDIIARSNILNPIAIVTNRRGTLKFFYDTESLDEADIYPIGHIQKALKENFDPRADLRNTALNIGTWHVPEGSVSLCMDLDADLNLTMKEQEIEEFYRVLRKGGAAIIEAPQDSNRRDPDTPVAGIIKDMMENIGFLTGSSSLQRYDKGCYVVGIRP